MSMTNNYPLGVTEDDVCDCGPIQAFVSHRVKSVRARLPVPCKLIDTVRPIWNNELRQAELCCPSCGVKEAGDELEMFARTFSFKLDHAGCEKVSTPRH